MFISCTVVYDLLWKHGTQQDSSNYVNWEMRRFSSYFTGSLWQLLSVIKSLSLFCAKRSAVRCIYETQVADDIYLVSLRLI